MNLIQQVMAIPVLFAEEGSVNQFNFLSKTSISKQNKPIMPQSWDCRVLTLKKTGPNNLKEEVADVAREELTTRSTQTAML
jgi:hypothetical protein